MKLKKMPSEFQKALPVLKNYMMLTMKPILLVGVFGIVY